MADTRAGYAQRRLQHQQLLNHFNDQLVRERRAREMAEISVQSFRKQIEQQREELQSLQSPPQRQEKTMLASEQLAALKRQQKSPLDTAGKRK